MSKTMQMLGVSLVILGLLGAASPLPFGSALDSLLRAGQHRVPYSARLIRSIASNVNKLAKRSIESTAEGVADDAESDAGTAVDGVTSITEITVGDAATVTGTVAEGALTLVEDAASLTGDAAYYATIWPELEAAKLSWDGVKDTTTGATDVIEYSGDLIVDVMDLMDNIFWNYIVQTIVNVFVYLGDLMTLMKYFGESLMHKGEDLLYYTPMAVAEEENEDVRGLLEKVGFVMAANSGEIATGSSEEETEGPEVEMGGSEEGTEGAKVQMEGSEEGTEGRKVVLGGPEVEMGGPEVETQGPGVGAEATASSSVGGSSISDNYRKRAPRHTRSVSVSSSVNRLRRSNDYGVSVSHRPVTPEVEAGATVSSSVNRARRSNIYSIQTSRLPREKETLVSRVTNTLYSALINILTDPCGFFRYMWNELESYAIDSFEDALFNGIVIVWDLTRTNILPLLDKVIVAAATSNLFSQRIVDILRGVHMFYMVLRMAGKI